MHRLFAAYSIAIDHNIRRLGVYSSNVQITQILILLSSGASRGIGAGTSLLLTQRGADIHVHYSSSEDSAKEIVKKIQAMGRKADLIKAALS